MAKKAKWIVCYQDAVDTPWVHLGSDFDKKSDAVDAAAQWATEYNLDMVVFKAVTHLELEKTTNEINYS